MNITTHIQTVQIACEMQPICYIDTSQETVNSTSFNKIISEVLDELFTSLNCKQAIYSILKEKYKINPKNISEKIEEFTHALEEIFKDASAILEMKIISLIHDKMPNFKHHPKMNDISFNSYLKDLKENLISPINSF